MIATPSEAACPLCKHKVYDYGSYTYCSTARSFVPRRRRLRKTRSRTRSTGTIVCSLAWSVAALWRGSTSPMTR